MADIERIFRAWTKSPRLQAFREPAEKEQLDAVATRLGIVAASPVRRLYCLTNGGEFLDGNVQIHPVTGKDLSLARASEFLRGVGWPVPPQLLVTGSDGQGDHWGLWSADHGEQELAVVIVGQLFEPGSLAIAATSLERFLTVRTAYYCMLLEGGDAALDEIDVPVDLRTDRPDDRTWLKIRSWADPALIGVSDDPYEARMTPNEVDSFLSSRRQREVGRG